MEKMTRADLQKQVMSTLEKRKPTYAEMLPSHVPVERFIKSAMLYVMRHPELLDCEPSSIINSVNNAAELGLDFTQAKGLAYIIKYGNQATFMPGYRGFIDLARRSGKVKFIDAQLVYQNDHFEYEFGENRKLVHRPPKLGEPRGDMIGGYAIARLDNDEIQFVVMNKEELNSIRGRSKSLGKGPWVTDAGEMYRKIPVRRLFKYLPCSPDLEKALELDNAVSGVVDDAAPSNKSRTDTLADMLTGDNTFVAAEDAEYEDIPADTAVEQSDNGAVVEPEQAKKTHKADKPKPDAVDMFDQKSIGETK